MDWENERYVRFYRSDTFTSLSWSWQAQALFPQLLRKMNLRGRMDLGGHDPVDVVCVFLPKWPREIVEAGLSDLIRCKTVVVEESALSMPNYRMAQEAKASDALRKKLSRERQSLDARGGDVINLVTQRDIVSQSVTDGHELSHLAEPSLAEPSQAKNTVAASAAKPPREKRVAARRVPKRRSSRSVGDTPDTGTEGQGPGATSEPEDVEAVLNALHDARLSLGIAARRRYKAAFATSVRRPHGGRKLTPGQIDEWLVVIRNAAEHCRQSPQFPDGRPTADAIVTLANLSKSSKYLEWLERTPRVNGHNGKPKIRQDESTGEFDFLKNNVRYECDEDGQVIVHG